MPWCGIQRKDGRRGAPLVRSVPGGSRPGFTLVELVVSALLATLILMGMQSAVFIASKAIPNPNQASDLGAQSAALDHLALDISYAEQLVEVGARAVAFTVADHDGDGGADTIRYSWSGVSGEPLLRTFNAATPEALATDVRALVFTLTTESVTGTPTYEEGSETLLATYSPASGQALLSIDSTAWAAQYIPITLANGVVDYRTTRVRLKMNNSGSPTGTTCVELRSMRDGAPTTRVLGSASILESSINGALGWVSTALASGRYLDTGDRIGLVVRPSATPASCQIAYESSGAPAASGRWMTSANSGGSWTVGAGQAMAYEVWGVCRTAEYPPSTTRGTFLRASVTTGINGAMELNLPLASRPVVGP